MGGVNVLLLKSGTYNDQFGKASEKHAGDILLTRSQYAGRLVEAGLASFDVAPALVVEPEEPVEPTETPFTVVAGVTEAVNDALVAIEATWETIHAMDVKALTKVPGLGPKGAAKLKARAKDEVAK